MDESGTEVDAVSAVAALTDGVAESRPPWWIDPDRTPLRNTTHHIGRYLSDAA